MTAIPPDLTLEAMQAKAQELTDEVLDPFEQTCMGSLLPGRHENSNTVSGNLGDMRRAIETGMAKYGAYLTAHGLAEARAIVQDPPT